ncbi:arginine-binding periplasmic protein-like isoform X2 [Amphiura filiformis]|uniref:arginine-binding periplasmic protein-like isoform X2 n=1 Tax=Amphiura filiformis TaxID=82378 RepID=UPI003B22344D
MSIVALVVAVIGLILAVASFAQNANNIFFIDSSTGAQSSSDGMNDDDKIWVLAIGHLASSTEYIDEISGQIMGFDVDIANAVCRIAGKNCRWSVDVFTRCWDSELGEAQRGGVGLYSGFYDACTGWINKYERSRTFRFSDAFSTPDEAAFFVKPGNPLAFDYRDISNKKIGFIDGFAFDEFCVARQDIQGVPILPENSMHYATRDDLLAGIENEEVDAGFDNVLVWSKVDKVDVIPDFRAQCGIAGRSMMMRQDNTLWQWWNPAFAKLRNSTEYHRICGDLLFKHGHIPGPNPEDVCFDYE